MAYPGAAKLTFKLGYDFFNSEWIVTLGDKVTSLSKLWEPLVNSALEGAGPLGGAGSLGGAGPLEAAGAAGGGGMAAFIAAAAVVGGVVGFAFGSDGKQRAQEETKDAIERKEKAQKEAKESLKKEGEAQKKEAEAREQLQRGFVFTAPLTLQRRAILRHQLDLKDEDFNIAVVGQVSAGKSAVVNRVRGFPRDTRHLKFKNKEYGPGKVSNRQETMVRSRYRSKEQPSIAWWDMPGIGGSGKGHRSAQYYETFNLQIYDSIILFHSGNFQQYETAIVRQYYESTKGLENPPPLRVVRTKSDENLAATARTESLDGDELIAELKKANFDDIKRCLEKEELEKLPVYHISEDAIWEVVTGKAWDNKGIPVEHIDETRFLTDLGVKIGNIQPIDEGDGGNSDGDDDRSVRSVDSGKETSEICNISISNNGEGHFGDGKGESTNVL